MLRDGTKHYNGFREGADLNRRFVDRSRWRHGQIRCFLASAVVWGEQTMKLTRLRVGEEASQRLSLLKGRTGLTPNILCRIGFCLSL